MSVANIPGLSEIGKAHEYANHCRRLQKDLKDAQADASKYNNRERLFGMPVTSVRLLTLISHVSLVVLYKFLIGKSLELCIWYII